VTFGGLTTFQHNAYDGHPDGHERAFTMSDTATTVSIADAKAQLTRWVSEAETGQPVHITRRGRPVAVLVSEEDFQRLSLPRTPQNDLASFMATWRQKMQTEGLEFVQDGELDPPREPDNRPDVDWG
jgi:prevent-host-death family protein